MKKTILKRILVLAIVFLMIISTPLSVFGNLYNKQIYVYASTAAVDDELLKQNIIPLLIASGLVFTSAEAAEDVWQKLNDYWVENDIYMKYWQHGPEDPKPDLKTVLLGVLYGNVVWNEVKETYEFIKDFPRSLLVKDNLNPIYKWIVNIPNELWQDIKSFIDDNYDEGENREYIPDETELIDGFYYNFASVGSNIVRAGDYETTITLYESFYLSNGIEYYFVGPKNSNGVIQRVFDILPPNKNGTGYIMARIINDSGTQKFQYGFADSKPSVSWSLVEKIDLSTLSIYEPQYIDLGYGTAGIIDNPNYDWNNKYTDTKVIPIPIEMDAYGNPKTDENGLYLPSIDVEEWIDVQPTEIPNLDPTGTPVPNIPPFPDIENPDDDEQTGILIYIGNILQLIVGQLSKIAEGVKTIVANTNQLVFNTPNPVFDPTTGEQIDPETGEPIEQPAPEPEAGGGIIGDGIDTNIPTDFEWGDFKHFLDIFFIFIYFIVILILILLKFLQIVFTGLPGIAPNTDLFTAYPEILAGVDYVKNLQVGGLTITVHQAFEFVFLIFFYIFIIKQIRKLYNAMVFEESAIPINHTKDMKLDYYDGNGKINQYGYIPYQIAAPNQNLLPYVDEKQKGNLNYAAKHPSEYQNIKITDYTEG